MGDLFEEILNVLDDADAQHPTLSAKKDFYHNSPPTQQQQLWDGLDGFDHQVMAGGGIHRDVPFTGSHSSQFQLGHGRANIPPRSHHPQARKPVSKLDLSQYEYSPRTPQAEKSDTRFSPPDSSPTLYSLKRRFKPPLRELQADTSEATPEYGKYSSSTTRRPASHPQGGAAVPGGIGLSHAPPVVRGIPLISVNSLPDRLRGVFPFPLFNAVQSRCFQSVYESTDNIVVSAPTGSGKTAILELAICALANELAHGDFKVIYQAPTKALCAERKRDWEGKFATLGLICTELTGDTQQAQLKNVKNGDIIITTPEKWDSMTRRWEDHKKLLELVRLFLIDEVHILNEARGATLEVVVSRMKSTGSNVRFVALSATVPNYGNIATWLGKNSTTPTLPAYESFFGEEFRPVKLQKFVYGYQSAGNDFIFDKSLDKMLPEVIQKHSAHKPMMIFCMTRAMCVSTAKLLAEKWKSLSERERYWPAPSRAFSCKDKDLQLTGVCGVAFHHAGLDISDRSLVERLFLEGFLHVICCTSTLAVGINLPAYLVIIKNTVTWADGMTKEYVDLDVMQMLGRAGRPQFDESAVVVIMTKKENKVRYEKMVAGTEMLESCLHENLVEHMNAEIGLGTINGVESAKLWLRSTFFYVRLQHNPGHYKLEQQGRPEDIDQMLEGICEKNIYLLDSSGLISNTASRLKCTELGDAMARYYIKFQTIQKILALEEKANVPDVLLVLSQAEEFKDIRFRSGEKLLYKELNKTIKYPLKIDLYTTSHKTFLLIQSEIGMVEYPVGANFQKYRTTFIQDKSLVFQHCHRIIRCIIDCKLHFKDSISVKNSLEIGRCLKARAWENSPLQLRQIDGFGPASVKKLVNAGVRSLEMLEALEAHKIETIMTRNPPFGANVLKAVRDIPRLQVISHQISKIGNGKSAVKLHIRTEVGYLNPRVPGKLRGMNPFVNFLAERSDGLLVEFRRIPVFKLEGGKDVRFSVDLETPDQTVICHLVCEEIVGTLATHELKPDVELSLYPPLPPQILDAQLSVAPKNFRNPEVSQSMTLQVPGTLRVETDTQQNSWNQEKGDDLNFLHIEDFDLSDLDDIIGQNTQWNTGLDKGTALKRADRGDKSELIDKAEVLPNGNWMCRHKCGDKTRCKHMCCRDGLEKLPKPIARKGSLNQRNKAAESRPPSSAQMLKKYYINPKHESTSISSLQNLKSKLKTSSLSASTPSATIEVVDLVEDKTSYHQKNGVRIVAKLNMVPGSQNTASSLNPPQQQKHCSNSGKEVTALPYFESGRPSPSVKIHKVSGEDLFLSDLSTDYDDVGFDSFMAEELVEVPAVHNTDRDFRTTKAELPVHFKSTKAPESEPVETGCLKSDSTSIPHPIEGGDLQGLPENLYTRIEASIPRNLHQRITRSDGSPLTKKTLFRSLGATPGPVAPGFPGELGRDAKRRNPFSPRPDSKGKRIMKTNTKDSNDVLPANPETNSCIQVEDTSAQLSPRKPQGVPTNVLDFLGGCIIYSAEDPTSSRTN